MKKRSSYYYYSEGDKYQGKPINEIFHEIYEDKSWRLEGLNESLSGPGSELGQTVALREQLPVIFRQLHIHYFLDIPCGDFNWMSQLKWEDIYYHGGDIIRDLILRNQKIYGSKYVTFEAIDIINDRLPAADLLFCRDCLVHFSFEDIFRTLSNIRRSNIKYLMATTFPEENENEDIHTGGWRPLNMTLPPFNFPEPEIILNENCTEGDGLFRDKSMACWRVKDL